MYIKKSWMSRAVDLDQMMSLTSGGSELRGSLTILVLFILMICSLLSNTFLSLLAACF
jgi:hypothetical protein